MSGIVKVIVSFFFSEKVKRSLAIGRSKQGSSGQAEGMYVSELKNILWSFYD